MFAESNAFDRHRGGTTSGARATSCTPISSLVLQIPAADSLRMITCVSLQVAAAGRGKWENCLNVVRQ